MDIVRFRKCLQFTMGNEGGAANDPLDHGGPTSRGGITLATLRRLSAEMLGHDWDKNDDGVIDERDLALLTDNDLMAAYSKYYDGDMDDIHSDVIAIKLFDFRFNCGPVSGTKILQMAINHLGGHLVLDGNLGPKTVALINALPEAGLTVQFMEDAVHHYRAIVAGEPSQRKWLNGWINRANRLPHV